MNPSPGTLLVVDDNEMNRDMLSRRLRKHGYDVVTAVDGADALAMVDAQEFALVLLDIEMPGLSGLDVLKRLRERRSTIRTADHHGHRPSREPDIVNALNCGANDYLAKPVDLAIAVARIQTQFARKQAEAALQESEERYALAAKGRE